MKRDDLIHIGGFIHIELRDRRLGWDRDLQGACALASLLLADVIWRVWKRPCAVVMGEFGPGNDPHCWVEVEGYADNFIVDITATQFNDTYGTGPTYPRTYIPENGRLYVEQQRYVMDAKRSRNPFEPNEELAMWCWNFRESIRVIYKETRRDAVKLGLAAKQGVAA